MRSSPPYMPFLLIILLLISGACSSALLVPGDPNDPTSIEYPALEGRALLFVHILNEPGRAGSGFIQQGESLGTIQPHPTRYSDRHHDAVIKSKDLYMKNDFTGAARALQDAVRDEPNNLFIMNEYARALYKVEERYDECSQIYSSLVEQLDSKLAMELVVQNNTVIIQPGEEQTQPVDIQVEFGGISLPSQAWLPEKQSQYIIILDMWFIEAYWKLGTRYLDAAEWRKAAFEISRVLAAVGIQSQPELAEQAFSYLTEAYFEMGKKNWARYYGEITLRLYPRNTYVLPYLEKVKKD